MCISAPRPRMLLALVKEGLRTQYVVHSQSSIMQDGLALNVFVQLSSQHLTLLLTVSPYSLYALAASPHCAETGKYLIHASLPQHQRCPLLWENRQTATLIERLSSTP